CYACLFASLSSSLQDSAGHPAQVSHDQFCNRTLKVPLKYLVLIVHALGTIPSSIDFTHQLNKERSKDGQPCRTAPCELSRDPFARHRRLSRRLPWRAYPLEHSGGH